MNDLDALYQEAVALAQRGRHADAVVKMRAVAARAPEHAGVANNLGAMEQAAGNLKRARDAFRAAARLDPAGPVPRLNLAEVLLQLGERAAAIEALRVAATLAPDDAAPWLALGRALCGPESAREAVAPLRRALALDPASAAAARALGDALQHSGEHRAAIPHYERARELGDVDPETLAHLGHALMEAQEPARAVAVLRASLAEAPRHDRASYDLGKCLFELGEVEEGVELLRFAGHSSDAVVAEASLRSLAVVLPGSPADDQAAVLALRRRFAERIPVPRATGAKAAARAPRGGAAAAPERPLRVGYLSSFFHRDNWMKPVWALVAHHDRARFAVHLLNTSPGGALAPGHTVREPDQVHDLSSLSNDAAAAAVRALDLDLLVDLNGYSAPERLPLLRARLARAVIGWFNMYATTGIPEVDFLIGDGQVVTGEDERHYGERILRVSGSYLTYSVGYATPDVAPPPCLTRGYLTFGSLASLYKLTDAVVDVWAALLRDVPDARLLLKNAGLGAEASREHLLARFEARGAPRARIELEGPADHFEFLRAYDRVDVALDTFPYSGGTTTSEALWQGVPVMTHRGDRWACRTSASILAAAGLTEFVQADAPAYADALRALARDPATPERLHTLRAGMREHLRRSTLFDVPAFTRAMEALYRSTL